MESENSFLISGSSNDKTSSRVSFLSIKKYWFIIINNDRFDKYFKYREKLSVNWNSKDSEMKDHMKGLDREMIQSKKLLPGAFLCKQL